MSHSHHHHVDPNAGDRRVLLAVGVNLGLTVAQVVGGLLSGSLALIADALHNFSDAISLIIAFGARKIARRPATEIQTSSTTGTPSVATRDAVVESDVVPSEVIGFPVSVPTHALARTAIAIVVFIRRPPSREERAGG